MVAGNILSSHKLSSLHTMVKAQGFNVQSRAGWRTSVGNNYIDATLRGFPDMYIVACNMIVTA